MVVLMVVGFGWVADLVARVVLSLYWARAGLGLGLEADLAEHVSVAGRWRWSVWKIHSAVQPVSSLCMPTYAVSPGLEWEYELEGSLGGKTHMCLSSSTIVLPV